MEMKHYVATTPKLRLAYVRYASVKGSCRGDDSQRDTHEREIVLRPPIRLSLLREYGDRQRPP